MPNAKQVSKYEGARPKFLLIGPTGSGKTSQFLTLPGKKFMYCFDPSAINSLVGHDVDYETFYPDMLDLRIQSLAKSAQKDTATQPKSADTYFRWEKDFEKKIAEKFFDPYESLGFDSFTTFSDIVMDAVLYLNGRPGKFPEQDDWAAQMNTISNVVRTLVGMNKYLLFTAHDNLLQDETTKRIMNQIMLTGKLRVKLPLLFSEIYHCECQSTPQEVKYVIQTRPDRINPTIRTTSKKLEMFHDVTIKDWNNPQNYGLGKIIKEVT